MRVFSGYTFILPSIFLNIFLPHLSSAFLPASHNLRFRTNAIMAVTSNGISDSTSSTVINFPKLIVLDLDNTIWTPELYQLKKLKMTNRMPVAGKDVTLFPGTEDLMAKIRSGDYFPVSTKFAVASRTQSVEWAFDLLDQFQLRDIFAYTEIFPSNKRQHFESLQRSSGIAFKDMLFFDDARDGKYGNCEPVSDMGVLSVHCPNGLYENSVWQNALKRFDEWDKSPNTIIEWDGSVTKPETSVSQQQEGTVKTINYEKAYGFISYSGRVGRINSDIFFHFSNLPKGVIVEQGDKLRFSVTKNPRNGKIQASNIEVADAASGLLRSNSISMRAFSMNMPFAALLANGYKTLESRNGTMFKPYPPGTQMLLHVGHRTYPDGNRHLEILRDDGLNEDDIQQLKSLPSAKFGKGMLVAIMELGKTYDTTVAERSSTDVQRKICAYGADSGRRVTEIRKVAYLKRPIVMAAKGGVFKVRIDSNVVPDDWKLSPGMSRAKAYRVDSTTSKFQGKGNNDGTSKKLPLYSISG